MASKKLLRVTTRTANLTGRLFLRLLARVATKITEQAYRYNPQKSTKHITRGRGSLQAQEFTTAELKAFKKYARKYNVQFAVEKHPTDPKLSVLLIQSNKLDNMQMAMESYAINHKLKDRVSLKDKILQATRKSKEMKLEAPVAMPKAERGAR